MPKITAAIEKQLLLAKMELDRQTLAAALTRVNVQAKHSNGWASTTALAAGAVAGWPKFLRKPLRAIAAMSLKERLNEVLTRRLRRHEHDEYPVERVAARAVDPTVERLAKLAEDLRNATELAAGTDVIEQLRRDLDDEVLRIRERKAREAITPAPMPERVSVRAPAVVPGSVEEAILEADAAREPVKAPPSGY